MRWSELSCGVLAVTLSLGCEALVQFKKVPDGTGGGAGTGATSGAGGGSSSTGGAGGAGNGGAASSTGGASNGGTTGAGGTTGTEPIPCSFGSQCDDGNPCTVEVCPTGICLYSNVAPGTFVANPDPNDCLKTVCDDKGAAKEAPDDSESPGMPPGECSAFVCVGGLSVNQPANEGASCSATLTNICQKAAACTNGTCSIVNQPNGSLPVGICATVTCTDGSSSKKTYHDDKCLDPTPKNCKVPQCGGDGNGSSKCTDVNAPEGLSCIKSSGQIGVCNMTGGCCNGNGCD